MPVICVHSNWFDLWLPAISGRMRQGIVLARTKRGKIWCTCGSYERRLDKHSMMDRVNPIQICASDQNVNIWRHPHDQPENVVEFWHASLLSEQV